MKVTKAPLAVIFDADEAALFRLHAEIMERPIENYLRMSINSLLDAALGEVLAAASDEETRNADKARFASVSARLAKWNEEEAAR